MDSRYVGRYDRAYYAKKLEDAKKRRDATGEDRILCADAMKSLTRWIEYYQVCVDGAPQ